MVPPICNSSTTEAEAGGLTQVKASLCYIVSLGQPGPSCDNGTQTKRGKKLNVDYMDRASAAAAAVRIEPQSSANPQGSALRKDWGK